MSFFDTLQKMGLFQGGGQSPSQQDNPYGLDQQQMRQVGWQTLGNLGQQIMALSQQMTPAQRAAMMSRADFSGGLQQNLYNAAQMKLLQDKRQQQAQEDERTKAARAYVAQTLQGMPDGPERRKAMAYLQLNDLPKAVETLYSTTERKAPDLKTVRVGDRDVTYQWDEGQGQWVKFGEGVAFKPETPQPPSSVKEYEYAKERGYTGTYEDFLKMATAAKAGVALPAEMGARIGLGDEFITNDLPGIKKDVAAGVSTGPIDALVGWAGYGRQGEIRRRLLTGVDALRRNLTGAGMSATETEEYVSRYLPSMLDDSDTLTSKIDGLERDLKAVKGGAVAGKTGAITRDSSAPEGPKRLKYNAETGELE